VRSTGRSRPGREVTPRSKAASKPSPSASRKHANKAPRSLANATEAPLERVAIAAVLREIGVRLRLGGDNPFRARAYETGARAVDELSDLEPTRRVKAGTLTELGGIGEALAAVISDLLRSGRTEVLERLRAANPAALLELSQLSGLSMERARRLHDALGVNGVDELAEAAEAGRVREVRGFGPKSEKALMAAIHAYRARPHALRLVDAREAISELVNFVRTRPGVSTAEIAGAVRRWEEVVEELTVVAACEDVGTTIDAVAAYPPLASIEDRVPIALSEGGQTVYGSGCVSCPDRARDSPWSRRPVLATIWRRSAFGLGSAASTGAPWRRQTRRGFMVRSTRRLFRPRPAGQAHCLRPPIWRHSSPPPISEGWSTATRPTRTADTRSRRWLERPMRAAWPT
jgi:hypothetical protein